MSKFTLSLNISMPDADAKNPLIAAAIKEVLSQLLNLEVNCLEEGVPYHIHKITGANASQPKDMSIEDDDPIVDESDTTSQYVQNVLEEVGQTHTPSDDNIVPQQPVTMVRTIEPPTTPQVGLRPKLPPSAKKMYDWLIANYSSYGIRGEDWFKAVGVGSSGGYYSIKRMIDGGYIVRDRIKDRQGILQSVYTLPGGPVNLSEPVETRTYSKTIVAAINWLRANTSETGVSVTNWSKRSGISRSTVNTAANICTRDGLATTSKDPNSIVGLLYKAIVPNAPVQESLTYAEYEAADNDDDNIGNRIEDQQPDNIGNTLSGIPEEVAPDVNGNILEDTTEQLPNTQDEETIGRYVKPNWMTQDQFEFLTWTAEAVSPVQKASSARRLNMSTPTLDSSIVTPLLRNGDIQEERGETGRIRGYTITSKGLSAILPGAKIVEPVEEPKATKAPKTLKSFKELKETLYPVVKFNGTIKFNTPEELINHLLTSPKIPVPMDACTEGFMDILRQSVYTNKMTIGYNAALNICKSKNLYTEGRRILKHNECRAYFFPVNSNMVLEKVRRENSNHNDFTLLALPGVPSYEMTDLIARFTR